MKMRAFQQSIHLSAFQLKDCINQVVSRLRKKLTFPIWGHQHLKTEHTACHYIPLLEGFDMKDKSNLWICSIYYYLKCGMETEKRNNNISGRKRRHSASLIKSRE